MESVREAITTCQTKQLRRNGAKLSKSSQRWRARAHTREGECARTHCRTKQLLSKLGGRAKLPSCHSSSSAGSSLSMAAALLLLSKSLRFSKFIAKSCF